MKTTIDLPTADWKWATAEGSREFDRLVERRMTLREILEWQEEAEDLTLQFEAARSKISA